MGSIGSLDIISTPLSVISNVEEQIVLTPPSPGTTTLGCQLITIPGCKTMPDMPAEVILGPS